MNEQSEQIIWHQHSNLLMKAMLDDFEPKSKIVDLGSGHNFYVDVFNHFGHDAKGFDEVKLDHVNQIQFDVTEPLFLTDIDYIISFEVGEHIPKDKIKGYLDNLATAPRVLLSWAIEGQSGIGHINCQNNEYVIKEMTERGLMYLPEKTKWYRDTVLNCHCNWFKTNLLYFEQ